MTSPVDPMTTAPDVTPAPSADAVEPSVRIKAAEIQLGGDEVIQILLKPSWWYIVFVSYKFVLGVALLAAAVAVSARGGWSLGHGLAFQGLSVLAGLRVAYATLQWASRLYVLTNRRVMRFKGVLNVHVRECPLTRLRNAELRCAPYQRALRLGSVRMNPLADNDAIQWDHIAQAPKIQEIVERAIRRARAGGGT